jgi:membrane-associated phospholipid phosphatase
MRRAVIIWSLSVSLGLAFCSQNAVSQQKNHLSYLKTSTDSVSGKPEWFIASMLEDQCKLWTSPFRIKTRDLEFWVPVLTASAVTVIFDEEIYSAIKDFQNKNAWVSDVSPVITQAGDDPFVLGTGGLFFLTGVLSGNKKAKQTGLIALQTWFHTGFIVQVGKMLFGRQRPSYENGEDRWHGFPASLMRLKGEPASKYDAFPSGHTIEIFGLATVIAEQYKDIKIIPVISYTIAAGAGLSRITEDTHWLSDVILGAAMGYGIGKFMVRERKNTQWTLIPKADKDYLKLSAIYRF